MGVDCQGGRGIYWNWDVYCGVHVHYLSIMYWDQAFVKQDFTQIVPVIPTFYDLCFDKIDEIRALNTHLIRILHSYVNFITITQNTLLIFW